MTMSFDIANSSNRRRLWWSRPSKNGSRYWWKKRMQESEKRSFS